MLTHSAPSCDHLPQMFDAFCAASQETSKEFVSHLLMLSAPERAAMILSMDGTGELGEERQSDESIQQRKAELICELEGVAPKALAVGDNVASKDLQELDIEDIVDLDVCVPVTKTGCLTTLFSEDAPMPEVLFDTFTFDDEEGEYEPLTVCPAAYPTVVPSLDEILGLIPPDTALLSGQPVPGVQPLAPSTKTVPAKYCDPEDGLPEEWHSRSGSSSTWAMEDSLPGLEEQEGVENAAGAVKHVARSVTEGELVMRAQLHELIHEVTDDVVPFCDTYDVEPPQSQGKSMERYQGNYVAYRLAPVVL